MSIHKAHMQMVDKVNNTHDKRLREREQLRLDGFRVGVKACGHSLGRLIIAADNEQFSRGNDRPMCGGVFDYSPGDS